MTCLLAIVLLFANCAESFIDLKAAAPSGASGFASLKAGPDGKYFDRVDGDAIYVTAAFEQADAKRKQELLLVPYAAIWQAMPEAEKERHKENGAIALPYRVVDPIGRPLFFAPPCADNAVTLTEQQRHQASFSFEDRRTRKFPEPKGVAALRKRFFQAVGWKASRYLAWVPEGGFYELDLDGPADRKKLAAFWPHAPRGYRYEVRLQDGTLLETVKR